MEKPYKLPDPENNPEAFLVILYKTLKKIEYDNRAWDKLFFARCMKRTKELLEVTKGDVQAAAQCMRDLKDKFEGDGLGWTIETVIQYSFEWHADRNQKSDRECLRDLVKAYDNSDKINWLQLPAQAVPQLPEPEKELDEEERRAVLRVIADAKKKMGRHQL
jgi:hypothetical protein